MRDDAQVIVVGAGPVGLWVAAELALGGVATLVLEREEGRSPHSRALGLHPRSLEVLAMRGLDKDFLAGGRQVPNWHFGMLESRLDFTGLATPYPFMLAYPQTRTEEHLEQRAIELGVSILRGHAVTGLTQDAASVTLQVTGPDGPSTRRAAYVVGCDGAGSAVRKAAGIDFPGTDTTAYGFLGEVILDDPPSAVVSRFNADGAVIALPLGAGRYRVTGLDPVKQAADDDLTLADLRAVTIRVTGTDFGMRDPSWLTRFGNATRHAATYRAGRVLLAGDAAHMHWPAGGVGLNVGLQDAMNLGWKLAAEVRGHAAAGLLDSYHAERHPVGAELAHYTLAQGALIRGTTPEGRALRTFVSDMIAANPAVERSLAEKLTALDVAYPAGPDAHPLTGTRVPLPTPEAFGLLHEGRPVLLNLSGAALDSATAHASKQGIETHPVTLTDTAWADVGAVIVRPDGHTWWAADRSAGLEQAVIDGLGTIR